MLDYALLDFGHGRKLERFGAVVLDRPEVLAVGPPAMPAAEWKRLAAGYFHESKNAKGHWLPSPPEEWHCSLQVSGQSFTALCKTGPYKHVGLFPEQQDHWHFLRKQLKPGQRYLNLFAYTGAASMVAASCGADVYHVEASRSVINWAASNAAENGRDTIRWVCDDAFKFAEREAKRGRKYHGISMDPPVYGIGKGGARWRLEERLGELIATATALLEPGGFLVLNTYSPVFDLRAMCSLCENRGLIHTQSGWLSVVTSNGRKLELSKFVIAQL